MQKRGKAKILTLAGVLLAAGCSAAIFTACEEGCGNGRHEFNVTTVEATCGKEGSEKKTCRKCGIVEEKTIPATGEHVKDGGKVSKEATCTEDGVKIYSCIKCGTELDREPISHTGHTKDEGTVTEEPTCTKEGIRTFSCTECGETIDSEPIARTEHTKDEGTVTEEPTCTKEGTRVYHCTVCKEECGKEAVGVIPHEYKLPEKYWEIEGYVACTDTSNAIIPCQCKLCDQIFPIVYEESEFAFAGNDIRLEDTVNGSTVIVFDKNEKYLFLNLAGGNLTKILKDLSAEELYDAASKVLSIPAVYKSVKLESVKIRGFKTPNSEIAFNTEICDQMNLHLENLSFTAPQGKIGFDLSNVNSVSVNISGLIAIGGGSCMEGIKANRLTIGGSGSLTVTGGNGNGGAKQDGNGKAGGAGIDAKELRLSIDGTVTVTGGKGGAAYNRSASDNDGEGSNGKNGYKGGDGGCGIKADSMLLEKGKCVITAGNGSRGGDASECNRSEITNKGSKNVVGGTAGNGGAGANALQLKKLTVSGGEIFATGGNGGNSGRPGGCHDDDHSGYVFANGTTTAKDGATGAAGKGGSGISADCKIEGRTDAVTVKAGEEGMVTTQLNQN